METRNETEAERLDRKFNDQLQELRVMQTGAQLTAGFLLTLPFQSSFGELDGYQRGLYLALVLLAGLTVLIIMTPIAVHRRISGDHVKERLVRAAHLAIVSVVGTVALLVIGMTTLILDVTTSRAVSTGVAALFVLIALGLLVVVPARQDPGRRSTDPAEKDSLEGAVGPYR